MPVPRSPKWSGTLGIDVVQPLSEGLELTANAGMTFRSTAFLEESYNPSAAQKAFQKYDLRVGLRSADRRWEVAVVGKNLTNVITAAHAFNTPLAAGVISKFIQSPRTIAVQAKVSF